MIDIIIPAYNAHDTINKTLLSICLQNIKELFNVYIVNDFSENDYHKEIELFKNKINIKELKLEKNSGPGTARQIGIDNSNGKYIIFIDSNDVFFDPFSIENIYNIAKDNDADMVCGMMYEEENGGYFISNNHQGCLHGKIYKREFLEKNKIKFNDTRSSEDNAFNQLVLLANPKLLFSNDDIYLYKNNKNSITRKDDNYHLESLKWYAYNMHWAIIEGEKRNFNKRNISFLALDSFGFMFRRYCLENKNNKIIEWSKDLYKDYLKYESLFYEKEKYEIIYARFDKYPDIKFKNFLEKFEKKRQG
ncbi:MAG: glycosyltransferase family 2 protein [Bacilli bacterium]|nr:glycosyltransferase family 2 protein [Bacilli bacterium]